MKWILFWDVRILAYAYCWESQIQMSVQSVGKKSCITMKQTGTLTKLSLLHSISRVFKTTNFHFIQELNFCIRWSTDHFSKHRYVAIRTLEIFILAHSGWYISCSIKKNIQESIALNVYPGNKLFICFSWQDEIESWNKFPWKNKRDWQGFTCIKRTIIILWLLLKSYLNTMGFMIPSFLLNSWNNGFCVCFFNLC